MKTLVAVAALAVLTAGAAQAASPIDADVRCLAFSDRLAQNSDPKAKESGKLGQVFFLGRIDAASGGRPTAQVLAASMIDAARRLNGEFGKTEAQRCAASIQGAFGVLQAAGPIANKTLQAAKPAAAR